MKKALSLLLVLVMLCGMMPMTVFAANEKSSVSPQDPFAGKTISILGDSISTYTGVSNNTSYNSTIGNNAVYYTAGKLDVYQADTWWQQTIDALHLELLVNNAWSGSCILHTRSNTAGAYVDRCVQLHNDKTGETPDIIVVFMGTNDFTHYKSKLGTADIDYDTLIIKNTDGTFTYTTPTTSCEAYAIMLHKMTQRYPDAEIYCMTLLPRRNPSSNGAEGMQPTVFNAELAKIIERYGAMQVDLENCGITSDPTNYDLYIGDKLVHPGPVGMDKMTEALVSAVLGKKAEICDISYTCTGIQRDNPANTALIGGSYKAMLTVSEGYSGMDVTVMMGGKNVTDSVFADGVISIDCVTDDIVITATALKTPEAYRWELDGDTLISSGENENIPTLLGGSVSSGIMSNAYYRPAEQVVLRHDLPWVLEFKASGSWSGMVFSSQKTSSASGNIYLFKTRGTNGFIGFGEYANSQYNNYGVTLSDKGVDTKLEHTYRLENRIAADGSNMVYLLVDNVDYGAMNNYFIAGDNDQKKTVDWLNGKDLFFSYIGASGHAMNKCALDYLQVIECVHNYKSVVTAPTCTEQGYTTYTCACGDSYVADFVGATGHSYENGTCTCCGAKDPDIAESMSMRYDDHLDMTGKVIEIIDAGTPTSYQVGYGVEENKVLDTAVVTLKGNTLVATGIGTAKVKIDGTLYEVTVEAAPISLLLLIGQSNMRGSEGNANQSIVCPDGMVYSTYGDDRGESNTAMTASNATRFAPSALTGTYSSINVVGTTDCLSGYPVNSLTEAGAGKIGPDSGFAYEWVRQTGEKVWVVNAAHGGTSINVWQPGTTEYEQCQALFAACQETLRKEIAAGHFTLSHMAYFWCQGCSDRTQSAQWYVNKYLAMHNGLKTEMSFDHDSNADTVNKTFEFGGIIPVRVGSTATCYRDGAYETTNPYSYHESYVDLRFSGPRVAQYWMCNNPELKDIWMVCNIGEDWVWMPDGTNGVSAYFQANYPNGKVDYTPQVKQSASWYTPTTPKAVHDSVHYNQIGYNEIGRESVRNALIMLEEIEAPEVETKVILLSWDGYTEVSKVPASTAGNSGTLVVPKIYPLWEAKNVAFELTEGLEYVYYDLIANSAGREGTLTANGNTVSVSKMEPGAHYKEHLSTLPDKICSGLNIWSVLEREKLYYDGKEWRALNEVHSVTFPVNPGERIFATSFGASPGNGSTADGIRITWFSETGVLASVAREKVYAEFKESGFITVPEGAVAVNVPHSRNSSEFEIYLLDRKHDTDSGICGICGKDSHIHSWSGWRMKEIPGKGEPVTEERSCSGCGETETREVESVWQKYDLAAHYSDLPENVCSGLNIWNVLEHDKYYFANGTNWSIYSGGTVKSVTISVEPGDVIFATAWGKAGENGHATADGIRVSFFDVYGVAKTMTPAECYAEFSKNGGYLIAPEGAIAVNVAMWNNSNENELYILDRDHCYENGTCAGCGEAQHGPVITQQPADVEAKLGEKFKITVEAEGEGLKYQWYIKEAGAKAFKISSNKTASYAYTMQTYMHNRQVYCVVTDANGNSVQTETATISRPPQTLKILQQPQDARVNVGEKFSISPKVEGEGLIYQWYVKENGAKAFKVSSVRGSAYALTMQKYMIGRQVYCVITDKHGNSVTTDVATISLPPVELKILQQPTDVYAAKGEKFSISPKVQGEGLTYQWYYKEGYMKDFKASSNKTSAYAYSMQLYMNERSVYCVITDKFGNQVQTEVVTIYLGDFITK